MSRKRNPNFSEMELQILLDNVEKNKDIIFSKHSNVVTNISKKRVWEGICEKVNAVSSGHTRTVDELRKKWSTYASDTKNRISSNRKESVKTGGGMAPPELTPLQDKIVGIMGPTAIEGISGGLDTCGEFEDACSSLSSASTISLQDKPSTSGNNEMDPPKKVSSRKRHIQDEDNQSSQRLVAIEEESSCREGETFY
ncbi:myb/SANT-like DNA-binding domain-containing protein 4 [Saccostrea cucullata]|uniref:myb/SANT-like DNA-binding domain-containing protein 4 n=1 Tax=Saccostrea cuccullata TaxID=36930 RepID=UPI002ED4300A